MPLQKGYLWAFPLADDQFVVEKGDGTLKDYTFAKKTMTHKVGLSHVTYLLHLGAVHVPQPAQC